MARPRKDAFTTESIRSNRGNLFEKENIELPKKKAKINLYVSPHQMQGFKVPVKDEDGKIMFHVNPFTGKPVLILGKPVPIVRDCNFLCQSNNIKKGCLSYFEAEEGSDEDVVLSALAAEPSSPILTDAQYRQSKDIVKYELQEKLRESESEKELQKDYIAELEEKIKLLTEGKDVT
jgi:hypothetical protein